MGEWRRKCPSGVSMAIALRCLLTRSTTFHLSTTHCHIRLRAGCCCCWCWSTKPRPPPHDVKWRTNWGQRDTVFNLPLPADSQEWRLGPSSKAFIGVQRLIAIRYLVQCVFIGCQWNVENPTQQWQAGIYFHKSWVAYRQKYSHNCKIVCMRADCSIGV